jgi:hypothetical protein
MLRARAFSGANAGRSACSRRSVACNRSILAAVKTPYPTDTSQLSTEAPTDVVYDAVIIGGGMGGLTTAAKLVAKGAKVVVLEKYLVPGGSAAHYKREGYTFDVGSSMMFGFGDQGTTNLITKALESVGKRMQTVPDPTQVHYHCPPSSAHPEVRWSLQLLLLPLLPLLWVTRARCAGCFGRVAYCTNCLQVQSAPFAS